MLICAVGGTLALAAQRGTEPAPVGRAAGGGVGNSLRVPALQALYAARFCVGAVFGAMPVSLIAFATEHHGWPGCTRPCPHSWPVTVPDRTTLARPGDGDCHGVAVTS